MNDHTTLAETGHDRARPVLRIPWGAALLLAPGAVLVLTTHRDPAFLRPARVVLRILGIRHLLQAGVELRWPNPRVLAVAAVVDGVHAGSGVAFAAADYRWRCAALLDAAIATGFCLATARSAATSWPDTSRPDTRHGADDDEPATQNPNQQRGRRRDDLGRA